MATYTVVRGDCLWTIAKNQLGNAYRWSEIATLNGLRSPYTIYPGNVLELPGSDGAGGGSTSPATTSAMARPAIQFFGLQAPNQGDDLSLFATWTWDRANTESYKTTWYYDTGIGVWFVGNNGSITAEDEEGNTQSLYTIPSNATKVKFKVKPISETRTVNNVETVYWTAEWSTEQIFNRTDAPPSTPSVPTVTINQHKLEAELDNVDINATDIQFQIVKDNETIFNTGLAAIITNHVSYSCNVEAGSEYKVRCRGHRDGIYGAWSAYSSNASTIPSVPEGLTVCRSNSTTSVYLEWPTVTNATSYGIEYTTKVEYFDGSSQTTVTDSIAFTHYEITGLATGQRYFFRVRAANSIGNSAWSDVSSVAIGTVPTPPTTWSSTTTGITGETINLYWIHNTEDGSKMKYSEVELTVNGGTPQTYTITGTDEDDDENSTNVYSIDTSAAPLLYYEGATILWRVRTSGVTLTYGEWSIQRTIDIYAPPTLTLSLTDSSDNTFDNLTSFPFYVSALAGPRTQVPIGYHVSVKAGNSYETVDEIGRVKMVNAGEEVYSKYFDISSALLVEFSANNIDLQNNVNYVLTCSVTMNSGLTVEESDSFTVGWTETSYIPNAEIGIDSNTLAAYIRPYCIDEHDSLVNGINLSVYRREFDGTFTEIATDLNNLSGTFVTDPHPALDFARYRIVATTTSTGSVSYYDVPGYPVNEKAIVIQWNEEWSSFDANSDSSLEQPAWSGSILKLPYNVDVQNNHSSDVSLVSYIGRKHPVSYYGTQLGESSSWNVVIEKSDTDTIYALRRLAIWMGDVYVREPSGTGYWANINVSFGLKHLDLTVPVSLDIKRVEGGI